MQQSDQQKPESHKFTIILDKLPLDIQKQEIEEALKVANFCFKEVLKIETKDYDKYGIESVLVHARNARFKKQEPKKETHAYFLLIFENRDDMKKLAHNILFEKTVRVKDKKIHLMLHTKKGNYNSESSVCIQQLNYACTEQ